MKLNIKNNFTQKGFTLIELAITFTVISMIIGSVLVGLSKSDRTEKYLNTQKKLEKIASSLRVYANTYQRLPCPAAPAAKFTDTDFGQANCGSVGSPPSKIEIGDSSSGTNVYGGMVPFATLGLPSDYSIDEWGRRINYIVDGDAATGTPLASASSLDGLKNISTIGIKNAAGEALVAPTLTGQGAAYVLISHGQNGYLAYNSRVGATPVRVLPTSADDQPDAQIRAAELSVNERRNCPGPDIPECVISGITGNVWDATFIQSVPIQNSDTYFDDIVIYRMPEELL